MNNIDISLEQAINELFSIESFLTNYKKVSEQILNNGRQDSVNIVKSYISMKYIDMIFRMKSPLHIRVDNFMYVLLEFQEMIVENFENVPANKPVTDKEILSKINEYKKYITDKERIENTLSYWFYIKREGVQTFLNLKDVIVKELNSTSSMTDDELKYNIELFLKKKFDILSIKSFMNKFSVENIDKYVRQIDNSGVVLDGQKYDKYSDIFTKGYPSLQPEIHNVYKMYLEKIQEFTSSFKTIINVTKDHIKQYPYLKEKFH